MQEKSAATSTAEPSAYEWLRARTQPYAVKKHEKLYSLREACPILGIATPVTLRRWYQAGKVRLIRSGGSKGWMKIAQSEIDRLLNSRTEQQP